MRILDPGRARTARRVAGSVAVLGVAAPAAGLGTHSPFTGSTSPVTTAVVTGAAYQGTAGTLVLVVDGVQRADAGR